MLISYIYYYIIKDRTFREGGAKLSSKFEQVSMQESEFSQLI